MLSHGPHGGTYDKSDNFLGLEGVLCNVCYVVIVNIDVVSMILHKINILFEILKFTLYTVHTKRQPKKTKKSVVALRKSVLAR